MEGQAAGGGPKKEPGREPTKKGKESPSPSAEPWRPWTTGEILNKAGMTSDNNNNHGFQH